jgi:CHASE2 domain-containing sensor protein
MAQLFAKLQSHQPKLIGLDIYRDLPQGTGYEKFTAQLAAPNVIGIRNDAEGVNPPPTLPEERIGFNDLVLDADNTIRRNLMSFSTDEGNQTSFSLKLALSYLETLGISPEPGKKTLSTDLG